MIDKGGAPLVDVVVRDRQEGKTTDALRWLADGKRCPGYPGWTRVLVVTDVQAFLYVKRMSGPFDDLDHRIYFLADWQRAHVTGHPEVWLDDAERHLHGLLQGRGRLVGVSMTGRARS